MAAKIIWTLNGDGSNAGRMVNAVVAQITQAHNRLDMAAKNAMIQVLVHKQSTPLVALLTGLSGKSIHVKGLKDWAVKHGRGITIGLDGKGKDAKIKVRFPKEYETLTLDKALDWALGAPTFWAENPPPAAFKGFDFDAELKKLVKRAEEMARAMDEGTIEKGDVIIELTPEQLKQIKLGSYREIAARVH